MVWLRLWLRVKVRVTVIRLESDLVQFKEAECYANATDVRIDSVLSNRVHCTQK